MNSEAGQEGGGGPEFAPGRSGYGVQARATTRNALGYLFRRKLHLEGRHDGTTWHNWTHGEQNPRARWVQPRTEAEIVEAIRSHPKLRVVGSGHSFNAGVRSEVLLNLDEYAGVIEDFDHDGHVEPEDGVTYVRVRAGMRVRDINRELDDRGLAIVALPSHDAQSIAGVLSTDVHGTGREVGFVSASVVGLRVIDGQGEVHDVWRGDPLYRAAIGGIGAVGIITEVSVRCVPAFHVHQSTVRMDLDDAKSQWEQLLADHDHVNFYVFPFASSVQLHRWDRTEERTSRFGGLRELFSITLQALVAAWVGDLLAKTKRLPRWAERSLRAAKGSDLVLQSANAFNRTIYHLHQEIELAAPVEQTWAVVDRLKEIYEDMYPDHRMPFTLFEVRFTPANGTESLISAGAGDCAHVWVTIACNQSGAIAEYFAAVERYMREIDARPHLGKWCEELDHEDMARMHPDTFGEFVRLRAEHDRDGRFANDFTDRLFGPV